MILTVTAMVWAPWGVELFWVLYGKGAKLSVLFRRAFAYPSAIAYPLAMRHLSFSRKISMILAYDCASLRVLA